MKAKRSPSNESISSHTQPPHLIPYKMISQLLIMNFPTKIFLKIQIMKKKIIQQILWKSKPYKPLQSKLNTSCPNPNPALKANLAPLTKRTMTARVTVADLTTSIASRTPLTHICPKLKIPKTQNQQLFSTPKMNLLWNHWVNCPSLIVKWLLRNLIVVIIVLMMMRWVTWIKSLKGGKMERRNLILKGIWSIGSSWWRKRRNRMWRGLLKNQENMRNS